jgi:hypothetical protein
MAKTLEDFREQNLRVLEQLCPEDREYIDKWMKAFDKHHGITIAEGRPRRQAISYRKAAPTRKTGRPAS